MLSPNGKEVVTRDEVSPQLQGMFDNYVRRLGITDGKLTHEQVTQSMSNFGGRQGRGTGAGATPGGGINAGTTPGAGAPGFGAPGGNNSYQQNPFGGFGNNNGGRGFGGGGNNPFGGGGNNPFGGGGNNPFGGGGGRQGRGQAGGGGGFDPAALAEMRFRRLDVDGDGLLSIEEMKADDTLYAEREKWDTDGNNFIDLDEFKAYFTARMQQFQQQTGGLGGLAPDGSIPEEKTVVYRAGKLPPNLPALVRAVRYRSRWANRPVRVEKSGAADRPVRLRWTSTATAS